jgi:cob(I)alamin adenosyltransferase
MPRLTKIYTKTGDDGTTGLGSGERVSKTGARVEAYGTVDEANASVGLAIVACEEDIAHATIAARDPDAPRVKLLREIVSVLQACQHDLFDVGGDLCIPIAAGEKGMLRVQEEQTTRLERTIDRFNDELEPLKNFILPGGTPAAAALHLARTIVRRAERECVRLIEAEGAAVNPETVRYLNRLSDLLFVLGRVANGNGTQDVLWKPGANRGKA